MPSASEATFRPGSRTDGWQIDKEGRTFAQNSRGEWVPAIPLPYFGSLRVKCTCGAKFWNLEAYEGHYALRHILLPE